MATMLIPKDDDDVCPNGRESENFEHVPDYNSVSISFDGGPYIDINCERCGRSGCLGSVATLAEGIMW